MLVNGRLLKAFSALLNVHRAGGNLGLAGEDDFLDGVGNGIGYGVILVIVAFFRELFGSGTLMGYQVIPDSVYDFGYENNGLMILPPMALIVVGGIIWVQRNKDKELIDKS